MYLKLLLLSLLSLLLVSYSQAKKGDKVPCPKERDIVCVQCTCDPGGGYNKCVPGDTCPPILKSADGIKTKDRKSKCPYGNTFTAQCTLCDCSGEGNDHCAMCFALPVRKSGQPETINKQLPQPTDNRFFNYAIDGWDRRTEDEE